MAPPALTAMPGDPGDSDTPQAGKVTARGWGGHDHPQIDTGTLEVVLMKLLGWHTQEPAVLQ